jgi:hypothetical protein
MPTFFTPNVEILPQGQRELWSLLAAVRAHFTLYGGTALAVQLGHRESIDFNIFSSQTFDPNQLHAGLGFLNSGHIRQLSENTDRSGSLLWICFRPTSAMVIHWKYGDAHGQEAYQARKQSGVSN